MNPLQLREKEIFETLKSISNLGLVVIGGYAVNAYTLPRFSVDCDIVVMESAELNEIEKNLIKIGYKKEEGNKVNTPYHGEFVRYEKEIKTDFKVSVDILFGEILDRQSGASFSAEWVFENSERILLKGKTITEELKLKIIKLDALIVTKFLSCRNNDIRDIFMLISQANDLKWIKDEINKKTDFEKQLIKVIEKINLSSFKDNLQGVFGYVDEKLFEQHKKILVNMKNIH